LSELEARLRQNAWLWEVIQQWKAYDLPDCWVVAGAIAQTVWNLAGNYPLAYGIRDLDVVYFDPDDLTEEAERLNEARLRFRFPDLPAKLDVKNEARVHLWHERHFGYSIMPYRSAVDAIGSFPTTVTAVGLRWTGSHLECCAPFGLEDLLGLRVRPNKRQITRRIYEDKIARWRALWPHVSFVGWDERV
jgi:hypothetical protein